jgi:hypothetical protein
MTDQIPNCAYCGAFADGPMLCMGEHMAHVQCTIRKLNELLDPDWDGRGLPFEAIKERYCA